MLVITVVLESYHGLHLLLFVTVYTSLQMITLKGLLFRADIFSFAFIYGDKKARYSFVHWYKSKE
jgi:hypothetical protein